MLMEIISNFGFPAFICTVVLFQSKKSIDKLADSLNGISGNMKKLIDSVERSEKTAHQIDLLHECHLGASAINNEGLPRWWISQELNIDVRNIIVSVNDLHRKTDNIKNMIENKNIKNAI